MVSSMTPYSRSRYGGVWLPAARAAGRLAIRAGSRYVARLLGKRKRATTTAHQPRKRVYTKTKRYMTGGYIGRRVKRAKRRTRQNAATLYGCSLKTELGGVVTDSKAVYVGHCSVQPELILKAAFRAIVKKLYDGAGIRIASWMDKPVNPAVLYCKLYNQPASQSLNTLSYTLLATDTYQDIAEGLLNVVVNYINLTVAINTLPTFTYFSLQHGGTAVAEIQAPQARFYVSTYSTLTVQNRTLAGVSADNDESTNVSKNPVHGKLYCGRGNFFEPSYRDPNDISWVPLVCGRTFGSMAATASGSLPLDGMKPPEGSYFSNCMSTSRITIKPGEIRRSVLKYKRSFQFTELFHQLFNLIKVYSLSAQVPTMLGNMNMFGLEKLLDSRSDEPDISIGWEVNNTVDCGLSIKRCNPPAEVIET
ncbi:putative capsid protein [Calanoida sp. copepod associated circular virus]|uniref:putative capsid protein n=1 Tax=Calanoida sp. copepod associated circular virus TaxID=1692244 RepID=UPI0006A6F68F|nr:putative capsid protein [Calanoida sp. copepod associated circular virus]AKV62291.1 putative capsid protein [Calanoida sp. copepod associated circular virus]